MSEHTKTPWAVEQSKHHVYIWDSEGRVQIHEHRGLSSGVEPEHAANARHIVHCVNNHERLVTMLNKMIDNPTSADWQKARALLAALEAEKGGEL